MTRPRSLHSSGRWSVHPVALFALLFLCAFAGYGLGFVAGDMTATDRGRTYCTTYGTMTGTSTRYAAGECWLQYPDTPEVWYPLSDSQGGPR